MLDVLYTDNHLLAVNKPAGLVTQPATGHPDSLEDQAKAWIKETANKPGAVFLEAVHRLDRPVSGVVLFARTSKALSRLNEAMRRRAVGKLYLALLEGAPPEPAGTLRHWLRHGDHEAEVTPPNAPGARECLLRYTTRRQVGKLTLVEVELVTGRYHQIRAQFAHVGAPLAGDHRYGARSPWPADTIALHHARLTVEHPVKREPLAIEAPLPSTWPAGT